MQLPQPAAFAARAAARRAPRSPPTPAAAAEALVAAGVAVPLPAKGAGENAKVEFSSKDQARLEELRAKLGDPLGRGAA